jgi:uncharacterized protein (DUF58 family)
MSESVLPENHSKRNRFTGLLPLGTAILLFAVYYRWPVYSSAWSNPAHLFFYFLVGLIGAMGLIKLIGASQGRPRIPSWLRLTQHWMTIPLEGWIYLGIMFVLFTGAMLTKQNTLLLVFALMAGPFIVNGQVTFGMLQAVLVERQTPKRAMLGELFPVEMTLSNRRPIFALWMMTVRDEIYRSEESLEASVLFTRVSPRSSQTGSYDLRLTQRGRYRLGPVRVASRFPLGLVERSRMFVLPGEILIYPRLGRISPRWRMRLSGATELVSQSQPQRGVYNDDFHSLREFRSGDNPRAIHWRSTARRGEMILREFHQNREHTLAIVLDLFRPAVSRLKADEQVELALSFVASLLVERGRECRDGFLSLAASGMQAFQWEGQGHGTSLESLFDGLAIFEPGPANETADLLAHTLQHVSSSTQVLVVTTRSSPPPYQAMLTSRVDVLNLLEIEPEMLLMLDDASHRREVEPEPSMSVGNSGA